MTTMKHGLTSVHGYGFIASSCSPVCLSPSTRIFAVLAPSLLCISRPLHTFRFVRIRPRLRRSHSVSKFVSRLPAAHHVVRRANEAETLGRPLHRQDGPAVCRTMRAGRLVHARAGCTHTTSRCGTTSVCGTQTSAARSRTRRRSRRRASSPRMSSTRWSTGSRPWDKSGRTAPCVRAQAWLFIVLT